MIGDMDEFEFSNESMELNAWNKISDMFYKGYSVDKLLHNIIYGPEFYSFNPEVQCALNYFNARLLLKRGKIREAFEIFQGILEKEKIVTENSSRKLSALIKCRRIIEAPIKKASLTLHAIRSVEDIVEGISYLSDKYIENELASNYGKGLTNFFAIHTDLTMQDKENVIRIYQEQSHLVMANPESMQKQAVVTTLLEYFLTLWDIQSEFDNQFLLNAIQKGIEHSKSRKNAIFYVTTLITYAVLCMRLERADSAVRTLFLVVLLMKKEGITSVHEGIKQLFLCMEIKFPSLYKTYKMFSYYGKDAVSIAGNTVLVIELNIKSWFDMANMAEQIYNIYYSDRKRIYDVPFNEIIYFL